MCKGSIAHVCLHCLFRHVSIKKTLQCELCSSEYRLPLQYRLALFIADIGFGPNLLATHSKKQLIWLPWLLFVLCLLIDLTASRLTRGNCAWGYVLFYDKDTIKLLFLYCMFSRTRYFHIKFVRCVTILFMYAVVCQCVAPAICQSIESLTAGNIHLCLNVTATYTYLMTEVLVYNLCLQWKSRQLML